MAILRLLVVACVLGARAAGAGGNDTSTPLTFEDLPPGTVVDTQYAGSFVVFRGGPRISNYAFDPGFPHSGLQTLEPCYGVEFCTASLQASFTFPARHVMVWVGPRGSHSVNSLVFALRALDANGDEVARDEVTLPPSDVGDTVHYPLEVAAAGIYGVEVTVGPGFFDNEELAVDDFGFTFADPVCGDGIREAGEPCDPSSGENTCPAVTPSCVACACLPRCGNGLLDEGEECDDGDLSSTSDCCAPDCTARFEGQPCGDQSTTACDAADHCAAGRCDAARQPEGFECRPPGTVDACDLGNACDGTSPACPLFGADAGCTATVPDMVGKPAIPVVCEASGDGPSRCEATGFIEVPAGALVSAPVAQNLLRVTRTKRGKIKKSRDGSPRRRVLTLTLNRVGRRRLRANGSLDVTVRVTVTHDTSTRTLERLVRVLRGS